MVVFLNSDAVGNRKRLRLREDGRAGIALFLRIIPVLVIARKIQCDLSFLQLRLLHAEKIGVLGQQKFGKSLAHTGS